MASDYKTWCRLCGSLETTSEITDQQIHQFIQKEFQLDPLTVLACIECTHQLQATTSFISHFHAVDKMFRGLEEEDTNELTVMRLNAYRNYFKLTTKIPSQCEVKQEQLVEVIGEEEESEEEEEDNNDDDEEEEEVIIEEFIVESEEIVEGDDSQAEASTVDLTLFSFQCHVCERAPYDNMQQLTTHCRVEHGVAPSVRCCSEACGKLLSTWRRLLIHKERHFPSPGALKCGVCGAVLSTEAAYERHTRRHETRFMCSFCAKSFGNRKTLAFHESTHRGSLEERRSFQCGECEQRFITKQTLQNHVLQRHERRVRAMCPIERCGKSFFTRKAMLEHQRTHREKLFECTVCEFKTKTKSNLNAHLETHGRKERRFKCDQCGGQFATERSLKAHMLVHSEEAPFECDKCSKRFKRHQELINHLNVHLGIKPHVCSSCPRSFTNLSNLRKHRLKDHGDELTKTQRENEARNKHLN